MDLSLSLLLGRSRARTRRYLIAAAGIFVGTLGLMGLAWVAGRHEVALPISGAWALWTAALVAVGVPAVQAYRNDGLLVSLVLGLPVPLAFYLALTTFDLVYPAEDVLWGIGAALQFGVPAGILGFLVGIGGRRVKEWWSADRSESIAQ